MWVDHPLIVQKSIEAREYQLKIAEKASKKNCLVILPTALGKTIIALLVAAERLLRFPKSKILILSPTKPLCAQTFKLFRNLLLLKDGLISLVTGKIKSEDRRTIYEKSKIIIATPQCIQNDVKNGILNLADFSLIVFDECHRAIGNYAYTFIARTYKEEAKNFLILGLTASPGEEREKIEEIKNNLFLEEVEIRSERDRDVYKYIQPVKKEWVYVELNTELKNAIKLLENVLNESVEWLKKKGILREKVTKKELVKISNSLQQKLLLDSQEKHLFPALFHSIKALKLLHAIELIETQSITAFLNYMKKIVKEEKRVSKSILKDPRIRAVVERLKILKENGMEHPKLTKLIHLVKDILRLKRTKIIVFANYRSTVEIINRYLTSEGITSKMLIGQTIKNGSGLKQKEQIKVVKEFTEGVFDVLVCSSIGEEGLDISGAEIAIFYDEVPSAIRLIQRRGRVGRKKAGKVIFLITKGTKDEAFYWSSYYKEKKMRMNITRLRKENINKDLRAFFSTQ